MRIAIPSCPNRARWEPWRCGPGRSPLRVGYLRRWKSVTENGHQTKDANLRRIGERAKAQAESSATFSVLGVSTVYNALIFYLSYGGEGVPEGTESFTAEVRCEERLRASAHQAEIGMSGACGRSFSTESKSIKTSTKPKSIKTKVQQNQNPLKIKVH